jgi:hypothetical protein
MWNSLPPVGGREGGARCDAAPRPLPFAARLVAAQPQLAAGALSLSLPLPPSPSLSVSLPLPLSRSRSIALALSLSHPSSPSLPLSLTPSLPPSPPVPACLHACLPACLAPSLPRPGTEAERSVPLPALQDQQRRRTTLRADDLTCAAAATTLHPHRCARPSSLFPCLRVYSIGAPLGV